jgi:hypothetical protein
VRILLSLVAVFSAALVALQIVGCTEVETRPGVTKVDGFYQRIYRANPQQVASAAGLVMADMDLQVLENGPIEHGSWQVVARNFQDTRIIVVADPDAGGSSRVGVKVDPGQNEGLSQRVLDKLQEKLQ